MIKMYLISRLDSLLVLIAILLTLNLVYIFAILIQTVVEKETTSFQSDVPKLDNYLRKKKQKRRSKLFIISLVTAAILSLAYVTIPTTQEACRLFNLENIKK